MRVCFLGDYDPDYPRIKVLAEGLEEVEVDVVHCNAGIRDEGGRQTWPLYVARAHRVLRKQFTEAAEPAVDVLFLPHNNYAFAPLARHLARRSGARLVVDGFDPGYRTRRMKGQSRLASGAGHALEATALALADDVLAATEGFRELFLEDHPLLSSGKVHVLPVGADTGRFRPSEDPSPRKDAVDILYWGGFHPHHGLGTVLEAASILEDHPGIRFRLYGDGPSREGYREQARRLGLGNVAFPGFVPDDDLVPAVSTADVCLGIFADHSLAAASVTNKVYQALAAGRPVVTRDSPVIHERFEEGKHLRTVPPESPRALAEVLEGLAENPKERHDLGEAGLDKIRSTYTERAIGERFLEILGASGT